MREESLTGIAEAIRARRLSPVEAVERCLERVRKWDGRIRAFIRLDAEGALESARLLEAEAAAGRWRGPLHGVPVGFKDLCQLRGLPTSCGTSMPEYFVSSQECTAARRLLDAGAVSLGKLNMTELALGAFGDNAHHGDADNPWLAGHATGGSSSGSAAGVAAGFFAGAVGSDTGGSIRLPAACCGVVGLKPTYGRVSRFGLVAFASSLDQIGPITKDVTDSAIIMNAIAGHDPMDSTSADLPVPDFRSSLIKDVKGMKIGIPKEYFIEGMDPEVDKAVRDAVRTLEGLGAKVVDVTLPHTGYAVATYYILATSEASSNLARYDGVKYGFRAEGAKDLMDQYMKSRSQGFGPEVKRRIMLGTYALSAGYYDAYYKKGQQVRTLIKQDFEEAFKLVDVIATPTAPTAAFKIGEKSSDPLQMYLSDIFTISVNLAGIPGISIPCGFTKGDLPIGLQLLGKHFDEASVLRSAFAYEQATEWHKKRAKL